MMRLNRIERMLTRFTFKKITNMDIYDIIHPHRTFQDNDSNNSRESRHSCPNVYFDVHT